MYSFDNLAKYDLEDGHIYSYTVSEDAVNGYTSVQNGNNFTNTINQEKITVSGTKTWVDPDGTVHPNITINYIQRWKNRRYKQIKKWNYNIFIYRIR